MKFKKEQLLFLPLGGSNEIGMNVNLYHYQGKWIMIDLGAGFAEDFLPGIDMIAPDLSFVEKLGDDFLGLVLTHAHEDHLGGIPYVWDQLECPIWATGFTAEVVKAKMQNTPLYKTLLKKLKVVPSNSRLQIGPFDLELVQITHSIPEMNGIVIRTEYGHVVHTGDWKLDPDPVVGPTTNEEALKKIADEGVLAMVCDSTNVFNDRHSGSEGKLQANISSLVARTKGMVVVTTFASNVARVETIARAAMANGRKVALAGRSLWRITQAARDSGYLQDLPPFITEVEIKRHKRSELLVISTGCQGEPMAAMNKLVMRNHPHMKLLPNDAVIFSSKIIPGNEKQIFRLFNGLVKLGCEVYTEKDHEVHVSGHPSREELKRMYELVKPKIAIPVHGEAVHLHEHIKFAKSIGVPHQLEVENGLLVKLAPGEPEKLGHVESGYFAVDGNLLLPPDGEVMKARRRLSRDGIIFITMALTKKGALVGRPRIQTPGVLDMKEEREFLQDIQDELEEVIQAQRDTSDDHIIKITRQSIRRIFEEEFAKRPSSVEVQVMRV